MIKKFEPNDIVKLKEIKTCVDCDRGQYNQFLMSIFNNPKFLMIGEVENNKIKSFALFADNRLPPIYNFIVLMDIYTTDHKDTIAIGEEAKKWALSLGIKKGVVQVDDSHSEKYMESFGLKKIANTYEWSIK